MTVGIQPGHDHSLYVGMIMMLGATAYICIKRRRLGIKGVGIGTLIFEYACIGLVVFQYIRTFFNPVAVYRFPFLLIAPVIAIGAYLAMIFTSGEQKINHQEIQEVWGRWYIPWLIAIVMLVVSVSSMLYQLKHIQGIHEYGCDLKTVTHTVISDSITELHCKDPPLVINCKTPTFQVLNNEYICEDAEGRWYKIEDQAVLEEKAREYLRSQGYEV